MNNVAAPVSQRKRLPPWLKRPLAYEGQYKAMENLLQQNDLNTVCREAKCPNRCECFSRGTATFLVMGNVCTRNCAFCGVTHGAPMSLDNDEPRRICEAVEHMGLRHVVVTSVTRDDLPDGGAGHFATITRLLREKMPALTIEVLVPDFMGNMAALQTVLNAHPHVFNHNIETVPRLYPVIRPQAKYGQSLEILAKASQCEVQLKVKSGIMVGLGETAEEVLKTMRDLKDHGCKYLTIGQYLRPSGGQIAVVEFILPEQFVIYKEQAMQLGYSEVQSGPFVRSSYMAETMLQHQ
jgi:lipoic acid synthetase